MKSILPISLLDIVKFVVVVAAGLFAYVETMLYLRNSIHIIDGSAWYCVPFVVSWCLVILLTRPWRAAHHITRINMFLTTGFLMSLVYILNLSWTISYDCVNGI